MKQEGQESFVIPLDIRTKHEILDECNNLLELYSRYRRIDRLDQDFPKGRSDWLSQLEKTYLKISFDMKRSNETEYDNTVEIMDRYVDGGEIPFEDAVYCTRSILSFISFIGITRFFIPKKSFEEKLEDEL